MSVSGRCCGLQPAEFLRLWDSPGENTGVGCCAPGDLPDPGMESASLMSSALAGEFFTTSTTWEVLDSGRKSIETGNQDNDYLSLE